MNDLPQYTKYNNNVILTKKQKDILDKYAIDYRSCFNLEELIFKLEVYLNGDYYDDLDQVANEISEFNYYNNTNK